jgi:hypothetical protein
MKDWCLEDVLAGCLLILLAIVGIFWVVGNITGENIYLNISGYSAVLFMLLSWVLAIDVLIAYMQDREC